jgi:anti-sigma factor RsiW
MTHTHIGEGEAVDLAWSENPSADVGTRLAGCSECAEQVAALRASRALLAEDEIPDPGDVFWRAQLKKTLGRIGEDAERRRRRAWVLWPLAAAATMALTVPAGIVWQRWSQRAVAVEAWAPLPAVEDDHGFALLAEVVPGDDDAVAEEPALASAEGFEEMTVEEQRAVLETLRIEVGRKS